MIKVNLFDNNFYHTKDVVGTLTSTYYYPPKKIEWLDRLDEFPEGITVFSDDFIFSEKVDQVKSRLKIAWLFEPKCFSDYYERIVEIENKFDYILTYDADLLKISPKYLKYIVGQSRIPDDVAKIYPKTKGVSMIASHKTMSEGHRFRHQIVQELHSKYKFDLWGSGYKPFNNKLEPLQDYQFSICVMNSWAENFFTEVLVDCMRVGTIPLFWGCPNIQDYFDRWGISHFRTINDLDQMLDGIRENPEFVYDLRKEGLEKNFELCKKYIHTDDYIADILMRL